MYSYRFGPSLCIPISVISISPITPTITPTITSTITSVFASTITPTITSTSSPSPTSG